MVKIRDISIAISNIIFHHGVSVAKTIYGKNDTPISGIVACSGGVR